MNWAQFNDPVCNMCLAGAVVASWSLTHDREGSSPFTVMNKYFFPGFDEFSETFRENSILIG